MNALMHDSIGDGTQIFKMECLRIDHDGFCWEMSGFHFSRIGINHLNVAILEENLPKYRKIIWQFLDNNRKTEPVGKNHRINRHRSSQGFRVMFPQKFRSYLIKGDFIADGNQRIRQRLVLTVSLIILIEPMNTEIIHILGQIGCAGENEPREAGILLNVSMAVVFLNIDLRFNENIKYDTHPVSVIDFYRFDCEIGEFCVIGVADRAGTQFEIMVVLYDMRFYGIEGLVIKSAANVFLKRTVSRRNLPVYSSVSGTSSTFSEIRSQVQ